jgi:hypothetical protein
VDTHRGHPFHLGTGLYPWLEMEQQLNHFFFLWDLHRGDDSIIEGFDLKDWITALRNDNELRAFIIQELKDDRSRLGNLLTNTERVLSFMES